MVIPLIKVHHTILMLLAAYVDLWQYKLDTIIQILENRLTISTVNTFNVYKSFTEEWDFCLQMISSTNLGMILLLF